MVFGQLSNLYISSGDHRQYEVAIIVAWRLLGMLWYQNITACNISSEALFEMGVLFLAALFWSILCSSKLNLYAFFEINIRGPRIPSKQL